MLNYVLIKKQTNVIGTLIMFVLLTSFKYQAWLFRLPDASESAKSCSCFGSVMSANDATKIHETIHILDWFSLNGN